MRELKIATLGGGTGHVRLLEALKNLYHVQITAIVAMTDNGGSSGRLRNEFGIFPPGDLRNCMAAFINSQTLKKLFQFRFDETDAKREVSGHVFGNIFIAALEKVFEGNSTEALHWLHDFLTIDKRFRVLPVTTTKAHFRAVYADDDTIIGEEHFNNSTSTKPIPIKYVELVPKGTFICESSARALKEADVIIFAPGSIYTSTLSVLLPEGVKECIQDSKAKKIFFCNVMTQWGETSGKGLHGGLHIFKSSDFVSTIQKYIGADLDIIICNNQRPSDDVLKIYEEVGSYFVENDFDTTNILKKHQKVYLENLISIKSERVNLARHDSEKLQECLVRRLKEL
ncbi:MAG: hypothetical protein US74_C0003G0037 [Parcubacteria group bacterium GW2011_GWA2_38_13]|nr:MAG: hypothetical protein US74_C0003G0037 [Parcubacteria group bacterium GW2011_GWA2_38_13]